MIIIRYLIHKIKGFFLGPDRPEAYPVTCHACHRSIYLRPGLENIDLADHFNTEEHKRRNQS